MGTIHIQLLSDLHLEIERPPNGQNSENEGRLYEYNIPVNAEVLALLGDIGYTADDRLFNWLRAQLRKFKLVLFLAGNHEPYQTTIEQSTATLLKFATEVEARAQHHTAPPLGRFVFLNQTRVDLSPTVTVLGCTLWSRLNPDDLDIIRWGISDFKWIEGLSPDGYQALHEKDLAWLKNEVEQISSQEPDRRIIIFTHHAPTVSGTGDPKYEGGPTNSAFATEVISMPCWRKNVSIWGFGHTHWCCDFVREGIRVVSNQRGYREGGPRFDPNKVISLP